MDRELFISELETIKSKDLKEKLLKLWQLQIEYINDNNLDEKFQLAYGIIKDLFNPEGVSKDTSIPLSFFEKEIGKLIIASMSCINAKLYTIGEVIEKTKTEERPNGYSFQYICQEIKSGRLKGIKEGNRWVIPHIEVQKFLKYKGIK